MGHFHLLISWMLYHGEYALYNHAVFEWDTSRCWFDGCYHGGYTGMSGLWINLYYPDLPLCHTTRNTPLTYRHRLFIKNRYSYKEWPPRSIWYKQYDCQQTLVARGRSPRVNQAYIKLTQVSHWNTMWLSAKYRADHCGRPSDAASPASSIAWTGLRRLGAGWVCRGGGRARGAPPLYLQNAYKFCRPILTDSKLCAFGAYMGSRAPHLKNSWLRRPFQNSWINVLLIWRLRIWSLICCCLA